MNERCNQVNKDGFRCGSYAFNLYKEGIDQGDLCDVHYWQSQAMKARADQELIDAAQEVLASFDKEDLDGWMNGDLHSSDFNRLKKAVARAAITKVEQA